MSFRYCYSIPYISNTIVLLFIFKLDCIYHFSSNTCIDAYKNMCIWCIWVFTVYRARILLSRNDRANQSSRREREAQSFRKVISRGIYRREYVTDAMATRSPCYLSLKEISNVPATFAALSRDWRNPPTHQLWLHLIMKKKKKYSCLSDKSMDAGHFAHYRAAVNYSPIFPMEL